MNLMFSPAARAEPREATYLVEQRGTQFCVVVAATRQVIYIPPDFLRSAIASPADLHPLVEALDGGERYIDAVTAFEVDRSDELRARQAVSLSLSRSERVRWAVRAE